MNRFYDSISDNYGDIFQPSGKQINFLKEHTHGRILGVAYATGKIAKKLQDDGSDVIRIDLKEKLVGRAISDDKIDAKLINVLGIDKLEDDLGLTYCIGDSLVHLDSTEKVSEFLKKCYDKLDNSGNLVLQIINFYPFLRVDDSYLESLPTIKNEKIEFIQKCFRDGDFMRFNTVMTANGRSIENDVDLFLAISEELVKLVGQNGFKNMKAYDGFNKSEFDKENSGPLVLNAER